MTTRVVRPTGRGFLLLDAHPEGCARTVEETWAQAGPREVTGRRPVALVIGSSAGYGLAATVAGLARHGIRGVGVCLEKAPTARRTGTAGWYRTAATARLARRAGTDFSFVNADAFADATRKEVTELLAQRYGQVDHLVYSVAAPRRTDPDTGVTHASVLKPLGDTYRTRTLAFAPDGTAALKDIAIEPADDADVANTVKVMGGEDWTRWVDALAERDLLARGFRTVALSYIGAELNAAIYRGGTIGAAKQHLEQTARTLDGRLRTAVDGHAVTSVNGAAVTQSSAAIPGIALYVGLLRAVMGDAMVPPVAQLVQLWDHLTGAHPLTPDAEGRLRLDTWELTDEVQTEVARRWGAVTPETLGELADLEWFRGEFHRLYGFGVDGVDYGREVEVEVEWPEG